MSCLITKHDVFLEVIHFPFKYSSVTYIGQLAAANFVETECQRNTAIVE